MWYRERNAQASRQAVVQVMDAHPKLTIFGLEREYRRYKAFCHDREAMLSDGKLDGFELACGFLDHIDARKMICPDFNSYGLKHYVEVWARRARPDAIPYVTNGSFIAAAVHCGFCIRPIRYGSPNVHLNVSRGSLLRFMKKLESGVFDAVSGGGYQ